MALSGRGRGYPPTIIDVATYAEASFDLLRCGLGDPSFKATFLVTPLCWWPPALQIISSGAKWQVGILGFEPRFFLLPKQVPWPS